MQSESDLEVGQTIGPYRILGEIGAGGMGVVYRALDGRLKREVALKILPREAAMSAERVARFRREAEAVAALDHPGIVVIHSIDEAPHPADGTPTHFLTMELVDGRSLGELLPKDGTGIDGFFDLALPIAEAVAAAHRRGVVHRDLKPGNILVTSEGRPKILDFGLAKLESAAEGEADDPTRTARWQTEGGVFMGTPGYAAPEQVEGGAVDARSDVFALGCLFYRMLSGGEAFEGPTAGARMARILRGEGPDFSALSVPPPIRDVVERCLAREPERRYADATELSEALLAARASLEPPASDDRTLVGSPLTRLALIAFALALVAALGVWWGTRSSRALRTYAEIVPRIEALQAERRMVEAWDLARQALAEMPDDERLDRALRASSQPITVSVEPPGASLAIKANRDPTASWIDVGSAPFGEMRVPAETFRWQVTAEGYRTAEGLHAPFLGAMEVDLFREDEAPAEMVWVPTGEVETRAGDVSVSGFWIDRLETSNADFQRFVDDDGYRSAALERFKDKTGRPGPAGWRLAQHAEGEGPLPVTGVSWYEAQAYCHTLAKELPTFFHWHRAASFSDEGLRFSNFNAESPTPVGSQLAITEFGARDMAGNVREWVANESGDDRFVIGGAFNQPEYLYEAREALDANARTDDVGVRCMRTVTAVPDELRGPLPAMRHDFREDQPIGDDLYRAVTAQYSYDHVAIEGEVVAREDSHGRWIRETVTYPAAYGGEEIAAYLYLPRDVAPPYQTIVYFPGSAALDFRDSSTIAEVAFLDFLPASGRALVYPIYQKMYERGDGQPVGGMSGLRDLLVQWAKDVSRTVDYLETRPDVDADRLAFVGVSLGAYYGPIFTAQEPRFRASVLIAGGLSTGMEKYPPEIHPLNHAPRITAPTLMVAGRSDFLRDVEQEQQPLYDAIGMKEPEKRFAVLDGGHIPDWDEVIRETLDWLDIYLGPVSRAEEAAN